MATSSNHAHGAPIPTRERLLARRLLVLAGVTAWFLSCVGASWALARYGLTPTGAGAVPTKWPVSSKISPARERPTLLLFAHSRCPCTRASLAELAEIVADRGWQVQATIVLCRPADADAMQWVDELRARAESIPGVDVVTDDDAVETSRFGIASSGHVVLYAPDGTLAFSGGITSARGQAGDNASRRRLIAAIDSALPSSEATRTAVFGCAMRSPGGGGSAAP